MLCDHMQTRTLTIEVLIFLSYFEKYFKDKRKIVSFSLLL